MNKSITIILTSLFAVIFTGCASHRPQARVIDATNKAPLFWHHTEKTFDDHEVGKDGVSCEASKGSITHDFTF